jgi:SepF-like predicted cell division protein (DUF552 family)
VQGSKPHDDLMAGLRQVATGEIVVADLSKVDAEIKANLKVVRHGFGIQIYSNG